MKKGTSLAVVVLMVLFGTTLAVAQSSGSFSATGTSAACQISEQDGSFGNSGTTLTSFTASVQTSNGNGVSLLIRPSLVTGLFTQTKISTVIPEATADVGIQVCVDVADTTAPVYPSRCITYDQRFQQISSQLFSQLEECTIVDPLSGAVTLNPLCDFDLILSTLSAHSFDFVVPNVGQGDHAVTVSWTVTGAEDNLSTKGSKGAACVGPGMLTITQVKNFKQNSLIQIDDK